MLFCSPLGRGCGSGLGSGAPFFIGFRRLPVVDRGFFMQISGIQANQAADRCPIHRAALMLALAYDRARDVDCDPWQFAVAMQELIAIGVTVSDLRWLVVKGYAEHAHETTRTSDSTRKFKPSRNLAFRDSTRFVISEAGLLFLDSESRQTKLTLCSDANDQRAAFIILPHWDYDARVLSFDGQVVKEYRVPSPNQEVVLAAFQEEGWPNFIDDPLSPKGDLHPKQRLRDTIRYLNSHHKNKLIRFRGDGTGERIVWESIVDAGGSSASTRAILQ